MKEENTYYDGMEGPNLPDSLRNNPFVVPEGYFAKLRDQLQLQLKMAQHADKDTEPWKVPEGYFEAVSEQILTQVNIENQTSREEFTVPTGYFDQLTDRIQGAIMAEKLKEQVVHSGFTVPEGYSKQLEEAILSRTTGSQKNETKVRKLPVRQWVQYVAAACVLFVIGIASYKSITDTVTPRAFESHLTSIADDEIINYLSASNESEDMIYMMEYLSPNDESAGICKEIQGDDIEDYLNYAL